MERDEALAALREVAVEVLSVEPDAVTEDARFKEDLDADSLDLVELVMGLEERFDISVPEEDLEDVTTVGQAVDLVLSKVAVEGMSSSAPRPPRAVPGRGHRHGGQDPRRRRPRHVLDDVRDAHADRGDRRPTGSKSNCPVTFACVVPADRSTRTPTSARRTSAARTGSRSSASRPPPTRSRTPAT